MKQFEYKCIYVNQSGNSGHNLAIMEQKVIDTLGIEGWELVSTQAGNTRVAIVMFFKRELAPVNVPAKSSSK